MTYQPGDCLLYRGTGFYSWLIAIKTWHDVSHVEVFVGRDKTGALSSVASRNGIGVGQYPLRLDGLIAVLRPTAPFNLADAMKAFHAKYEGQKYDWLGLLRFAWRSKVVPDCDDNRQFCSEFATRFYRAGGLDPFNNEDADAIAPATFLLSDKFVDMEVTHGSGVR